MFRRQPSVETVRDFHAANRLPWHVGFAIATREGLTPPTVQRPATRS